MYTGCNFKTAKLLDCALIRVNAVIGRIRYVNLSFATLLKRDYF